MDSKLALTFIKIVEQGSMVAAARALGVTRALMSQQLRELETGLGARLITRSTRSMALTEAGRAFYEEAKHMEAAWLRAQQVARATEARLSGRLRVTLPGDLMATASLAMASFSAQHTDLEIELIVSDEVIDIVGSGIDVALRAGWLRPSSLRARKLGDTIPLLCAHAELLAARTKPKIPSDLIGWPWLTLNLLPQPKRWTFQHRSGQQQSIKLQPRIEVDSPLAMRSLLAAGAGVGVALDYQVRDLLAKGDLIHVLPTWTLPAATVQAVHGYERQPPDKVRRFIDHCIEHLSL